VLLVVGGGICTLIDAADLIHNGAHPAPSGEFSLHFGELLPWAVLWTAIGVALVALGVRWLNKRPAGAGRLERKDQ
jgi:hypothetical protein